MFEMRCCCELPALSREVLGILNQLRNFFVQFVNLGGIHVLTSVGDRTLRVTLLHGLPREIQRAFPLPLEVVVPPLAVEVAQ